MIRDCGGVPGAMEHADDDDFGCCDRVVDRVIAV
jgi:hypothetical protein